MANRFRSIRAILTITLLVSLAALAACTSTRGPGGVGGEIRIQGAGATFPNPLYQKWFSEYNKSHPGVKFDYQSIGSGGGIKQITEKTVDFGGTDAPMTDEALAAVQNGIMHIPTVLGAVVMTYNLPGVNTELKLTPEAISGIYLGTVKNWNDPAIASTNPDVNLPANPITVVYRSDGSGTTFVYTDYLSAVSPDWQQKVGKGTSVSWPTGIGAKGNEGVTGQVKQTPYAIGYVELIYAKQNNLAVAAVRNSAGSFVAPSLDSITAAAASTAGKMPEDLRVSIVNPPGATAYPVASFTYLLVYKDQNYKEGQTRAEGQGSRRFSMVGHPRRPEARHRHDLRVVAAGGCAEG